MAKKRECRLANSDNKETDLREYEDEIARIIEEVVPGKHPVVYRDHFTTDELNQGEAVKVGRALSRSEQLSKLGKTVTTFRLFNGRNIEVEDDSGEIKGGRVRK